MKQNLFKETTQRLISALEDGVNPWQKPWVNMGPKLPTNYYTGIPYSGVNVFMFGLSSLSCGYKTELWMTFKQANEMGLRVRKGEKATMGIRVIPRAIEREAEEGEDLEMKTYLTAKAFNVFNLEQFDGSENILEKLNEEAANQFDPIPVAEEFVKNSGAVIEYGGKKAAYYPAHDKVLMPEFERFDSASTYYATIIHELAHWSGHENRLGRDLSGRFGSEKYAFEELVAHSTSYFTCGHLEIENDIKFHSDYIGNWLTVLKDDYRALHKALSLAKNATSYLLSLNDQAIPHWDIPRKESA